MKNARLFFLNASVLFFLLLVSQAKCYASHILGGELSYAHVSVDTYRITFAIYGDCSPGVPAIGFATLRYSRPQVCIYDGSTYFSTASLSVNDSMEVTALCPGYVSQCTDPSSTLPGVMKYVYSGLVTIPHTSSSWRFIYTGDMDTGSAAGRSASITNINSAGSSTLQLIDTLNNTSAANSNPVLSDSLRTTFCINQHADFYPNPVDPDSDSLSVVLATPANGGGTCIAGGYCGFVGDAWPGIPLSAAYPLQVVEDSFLLNSHTGHISFRPNAFQRASVTYNIREFRSGVLTGTSQHEFDFIVQDCMGSYGCLSTAPSCSGTPISGTVNASIETSCGAFTSVLTFTGAFSGLSYQWQWSTDSIIWNNISGAINDTLTALDTVSTFYRCIMTCVASGSTDTTSGLKLVVASSDLGPITGSHNVCIDSSITLSDATIGGVWSSSNGNVTVTGGVVTGVSPGADTIFYTVTNACGTQMKQYHISVDSGPGCSGTGVRNIYKNSQNAIEVYPNPATSELSIVGSYTITTLTITNLIGQVVYTRGYNSDQIRIDITNLPAGTYFLKANGQEVRRFVKN